MNNIIKFNGDEYSGDMTLKSFCNSLDIKNYQFFADPRQFKREKPDNKLKQICEELNIYHTN